MRRRPAFHMLQLGDPRRQEIEDAMNRAKYGPLPPAPDKESTETAHVAALAKAVRDLSKAISEIEASKAHPEAHAQEVPRFTGLLITHAQAAAILGYTGHTTATSGGALLKAIKKASPNDPLSILADKTNAKSPANGRLHKDAVLHVKLLLAPTSPSAVREPVAYDPKEPSSADFSGIARTSAE